MTKDIIANYRRAIPQYYEKAAAEFDSLVDLSIREDRTVSHFCDTQDEYEELLCVLLVESDDDCELKPCGGAGHSGIESADGVSGWGFRKTDDSRDQWQIEIFAPKA